MRPPRSGSKRVSITKILYLLSFNHSATAHEGILILLTFLSQVTGGVLLRPNETFLRCRLVPERQRGRQREAVHRRTPVGAASQLQVAI